MEKPKVVARLYLCGERGESPVFAGGRDFAYGLPRVGEFIPKDLSQPFSSQNALKVIVVVHDLESPLLLLAGNRAIQIEVMLFWQL